MHRSLTQLKKLDRLLEERQFTDSARLIVENAPHRASERGLHHVDPSSYVALLLWTLTRWERKVGLMALETMGVDLDQLARDLDGDLTRRAVEHPIVFDTRSGSLVYKNTGEAYVGWDHDAIAQPLLAQAEREARKMGHDYVGTEHLLLAMINAADPELKRVLNGHLMNSDNVRGTILELLGN